MVVQPSFGRVCWCSGRTKGRGEGISGGRVSSRGTGRTCLVADLEFVRRFERKREIMSETEKLWSDDFDGRKTAIFYQFCEAQ